MQGGRTRVASELEGLAVVNAVFLRDHRETHASFEASFIKLLYATPIRRVRHGVDFRERNKIKQGIPVDVAKTQFTAG